MAYLLLTGATGLLGSYLLADFLTKEVPIACLVRRTPANEPRHRIDHWLRQVEETCGFALPRPVVIESDLRREDLGIAAVDQAWISSHCDSVLHSAASLEFFENARSGEPFRTNCHGTRRLVEFAKQTKMSHFHHISTAYVCGLRSGRVWEDELDVGQEFRNDYERSKFQAELDLQQSRDFDSVTVYRPSIITGDSRTGYTSTFQGFYVPLSAGRALAESYGYRATTGTPFLQQLGLRGDEKKNLVPVDWVSGAIAEIVTRSNLHNRTYHLTNPYPTDAATIAAAVTEAIHATESAAVGGSSNSPEPDAPARKRSPEDESAFQQAMSNYRTYFCDDPDFDSGNLRQAVPWMPCPTIDQSMLLKLSRWALAANFGTPKPQIVVPAIDAHDYLASRSCEFDTASVSAEAVSRIGLNVIGSCGGAWTIAFFNGRSPRISPGLVSDLETCGRMSAQTLASLASGRLRSIEALHSNRLVLEGRLVPRTLREEERLCLSLDRVFSSLPSRAAIRTTEATPWN